MLHSILDRLNHSVLNFGRVAQEEQSHSINPWEIPKREKFYITNQELKTIGLALTHYKKYLRKQKSFEKLDQVSKLDNRVYNFIAWLDVQEGQSEVLS